MAAKRDIMLREDFQKLAGIRRREAKTLLDKRQWSGAYYLAGYVVECAIKACICKTVQRYQFPNSGEVAKTVYTHNIWTLLGAAGLADAVKKETGPLEENWAKVISWNSQSRYRVVDRDEAKSLYHAIAARKGGVLSWLRKRW